MEEMTYENRKHLIDLMFDGADENRRPYGVYVRNIEGKVFDYEIYGRFTAGSRFMKGATIPKARKSKRSGTGNLKPKGRHVRPQSP